MTCQHIMLESENESAAGEQQTSAKTTHLDQLSWHRRRPFRGKLEPESHGEQVDGVFFAARGAVRFDCGKALWQEGAAFVSQGSCSPGRTVAPRAPAACAPRSSWAQGADAESGYGARRGGAFGPTGFQGTGPTGFRARLRGERPRRCWVRTTKTRAKTQAARGGLRAGRGEASDTGNS